MKKVADHSLDSMIRSLQEHLDCAKQTGLTLTAQLLDMALIELKAELHGISPDDIDALCRRMEEQASARVVPQTAKVIPFPGHTRRRRRQRVERSGTGIRHKPRLHDRNDPPFLTLASAT